MRTFWIWVMYIGGVFDFYAAFHHVDKGENVYAILIGACGVALIVGATYVRDKG